MRPPIPYTQQNCPVTLAIRVMGRRWKPLVLHYLKHGPRRFNELRRELTGATQKMLTQTLREMEADGLVCREEHDEKPRKVIYSVTKYGQSLDSILIALNKWGGKHRRRLKARS